jgi:hypothetical protein
MSSLEQGNSAHLLSIGLESEKSARLAPKNERLSELGEPPVLCALKLRPPAVQKTYLSPNWMARLGLATVTSPALPA